MRLRSLGIAGLVLAATTGQVQAGFLSGQVASGDLTSVISGGTVQDFASTTTGTFGNFSTGGVKFQALTGHLRVTTDNAGSYNSRGARTLDNNFGGSSEFRFSFLGGPVSEFAFLFGASDNVWQMNAYNAVGTLLESYGVANSHSFNNTGDYFGIRRNSSDIAYVDLVDDVTGDWILFDNLTYAASAPVPEPASLGLL